MKAAPVLRALASRTGVRQTLVHTGQHYDSKMSDVFFSQLGIPEPDENLAVGSGTHAVQTGEIMIRFEPVVLERRPDIVLVYGDVNSTVACALVCAKLGVRVGHVEAGLRSFDRTMPEEINRIVTDQLSDLLFTPSTDGNENLANEGIAPEKVHFVGNVMIDTLVRLLPIAREQAQLNLPDRYVLATLHRPSNVDESAMLERIFRALLEISTSIPVLFPVHPRTRKRLGDLGLATDLPASLHLLEPQGYLQFLALQSSATAVVTDSGGIQEETTFLGVPCLTLRENTERPITITMGTNVLIGRDMVRLRSELQRIVGGERRASKMPPLWDGRAAERIADLLTGGIVASELEEQSTLA